MLVLVMAGAAIFTAYAAYKGLKAAPSTPPVPPAVSSSASTLQQVGTQAGQIASAFQSDAQNNNDNLVKTAMGTTVGSASTGATVGMASGAAAGATVAAATFGIGIAIGIATILWKKHEARIKGAQTENAGWNNITAAFVDTIQGIFNAYNQKQLSGDQAATELLAMRDLIKQSGLQFNHMPGVNWSGGGFTGDSTQKYYTVKCDKHCTVGCCVYNGVIAPAINNAVALMQGKPYIGKANTTPGDGSTMQVPTIFGSKYGLTQVSAFTLTKAF